jgi:hypothetical protein
MGLLSYPEELLRAWFDSLEKNTPLPPEPPVFSQEVQVKGFALFLRVRN